MHFAHTDPPPPAKTPAAAIHVYHLIRGTTLSDSLTAEQHAMLNHLQALRYGILHSTSASKQLECAILLIDVYEAILERNNILIYKDQDEVLTQ